MQNAIAADSPTTWRLEPIGNDEQEIDQLDGAIWLHFVIALWRAKRIHEQEFVECYEEVCCRIYRHVRARLCWNSQSINNPPFRQIGVARRRDFPKIKR